MLFLSGLGFTKSGQVFIHVFQGERRMKTNVELAPSYITYAIFGARAGFISYASALKQSFYHPSCAMPSQVVYVSSEESRII
jgi:hypothetical protein